MKILLWLVVAALCWPLAVLYATFWLCWQLLAFTGKVTAFPFKAVFNGR